jgi:putative ABC transport system permease protein
MIGLLTKVWRDLWKRPIRTVLTILGIAVGVAGLVAITSTARNVVRAQRELTSSTSQADISYWVSRGPANLVPLLEADSRIAAAELRLVYDTKWRPDSSWMDIELVGIQDWQRIRVNRFEVVAGRFPETGEILLDESAASEAGIGVGSSVVYRDPAGRERTLWVSGISRSPSNLSSSITSVALAYVPASFLRRSLNTVGSNQLLIRLQDPAEAQAVARRVTSLLRRYGVSATGASIRNPEEFPGKRELDALLVVMFIFSALGLLLSALLVFNTLSASIAEQINEIGALKALGATRSHVLTIYLLEAAVYGLVGTSMGLVLGVLAGWRLLAWIGLLGNAVIPFRVAPEGVSLGVVVGIGVALVAALVPARQGMGASVKEALESYGIATDYGQGGLARLWQRWRWMPPLAAMALRNLGRRRLRTGLTLLVVALSTAAFLSAVLTRTSIDAAISDIYRTYDVDAWVWMGEAVSTQFQELITTVQGVDAAEGWLIADGIVELKEARLWGLPASSTLYRYVMREGRWFTAQEADAVVLSAELADAVGAGVGDEIEIQSGRSLRRFEVVGVAIDNTIFLSGRLAGKAFMPRTTLGSLLGQGDRVNLFAVGLASGARDVADEALAELEFKFRRWRPNVQPMYVEIEAAREASRLLTLALVAMVVIVDAVGALGILNTLTLSVLERRREIGVLRAMGATDSALVLTFVAEGGALGAMGWIIGVLIGLPAARLFTIQMSRVLFTLDLVSSPAAILASLMFTLGLAIVSSLGPALAAAQTPTSAALRYE